MKKTWIISLLAMALINGCASIGPSTIERDRFEYSSAIGESWKEMMLLNIVKLRYADMPLFAEVASVVSGYTLENTLSLSAFGAGLLVGSAEDGGRPEFDIVLGSVPAH